MLQMARGIAMATLMSASVLANGLMSIDPAVAQAGGDQAPKQVALTQKTIDGLVATQTEMSATQDKGTPNESDQPDPKVLAKMDAIAKKHGFTSFADYEAAIDSMGIVMSGIDPETKTYVGPAVVIKKQIAQIQADKTLAAGDKAQALKEMNEALKAADSTPPLAGNADIVAKNYDKLSAAFQSGE